MNIKSGHFEMTGADIDLDLGFVPDVFVLFTFEDTTNPNMVWWFKPQEDDASGQQEGVFHDGSLHSTNPTLAYCPDSQGITEYDAKVHRVMVESPIAGRGKIEADVADWATGTSYASGQRSSTAIGTIVRPPVHNGRVFELTTHGGNGGTAPTSWDVQPGDTVTDSNNTWTCIKEEVVVGGAKGVSIASQLQTDSEEAYFIAFASDQSKDHGDAAAW